MRSKANIKTHPIHPILVAFPLAFYFGTFLFDTIFCFRDGGIGTTGQYLHIAALISAVLAAVPGVVDYLFTVPPKSSAKTRAATHGLVNTAVLVLFAVALFCKYAGVSWLVILAMEGMGVLLTVYAGWLGGTLVYRNQIGVDVRYAEAGKWKELYIEGGTGPYEVCTTDELQRNQMKLVHINGKRIVIARSNEGYVAFDDRCPHKGGALIGGMMMCGTVQCPWHGSQFNVKTGEVNAGPAKENIATYSLSDVGGKVFLTM